jgi:hypothetical protein
MALTYPLVSISSRLQVQKNDSSKDAYKVIIIVLFFLSRIRLSSSFVLVIVP